MADDVLRKNNIDPVKFKAAVRKATPFLPTILRLALHPAMAAKT